MELVLQKLDFPRTVEAVTSKSIAHRMLICAAFSLRSTHIKFRRVGSDILHTIHCLQALGAGIRDIRESEDGVFECVIEPVQTIPEEAVLDCGDSGSTLRFLIPVVAAFGIYARFLREGRLGQRPLQPLTDLLEQHGVRLYTDGEGILHSEGRLEGDSFEISGQVSSQFISGMLFAMSLMPEPSRLTITGPVESEPYIRLTAGILSAYGVTPQFEGNVVEMPGNRAQHLHRPRCYMAEGDWSGSAVFLCAGAIGKHPVRVSGIRLRTLQGDRRVVDILSAFGAKVYKEADNSVTVAPGRMHGIEIDGRDIPDLIPALACVAAAASGRTVIRNAERLRLKESDRLSALSAMLGAMGVRVTETKDGLEILGGRPLHGAAVDALHDHRMAMAASLLALLIPAEESVRIRDAESVSKSWPGYWSDLGVRIPEQEETD